MSFVHLRVHSNFSMLAGTRRVEDLVAAAAAAQMPAIALADTDGMYAVVPFQRACEEAGVRPIYGVELTEPGGGAGRVAPPDGAAGIGYGAAVGAADTARGCRGGRSPATGGEPPVRVTLLARTRAGYAELCRVTTRRRLDEDFSLGAALDRLSEDVVVLADDPRVLERLAGRRHAFAALPVSIGREAAQRRWRLRQLASRLGLRTVAAGDVFFIKPREHFTHRLLTAVRTRATVGTLPPGAAAGASAFLHSPEEVRRAFHDDPASVAAALEIAGECRFDLDLRTRKLPRFRTPAEEGSSAMLRRIARRGLANRLAGRAIDGPVRREVEESLEATARAAASDGDTTPPPGVAPGEWRSALETLERELAVIDAKGLADYFLVCWDIVRFARGRGMPSLGRGSAGNSIVSYALGITHMNPLRHNLFFERFLNPEREHLPDFDIDFGTEDREEVLRYIFRRYGAERVAMIGTYSTLKARAAIREIAKALGVPEGEVAPFVRRLPFFTSVERLEEICAISPGSVDIPFDREPLRTILRLALRVGEFPRHMATHPCGLVISPTPITDFVPLQRGDKGYEITQWSMHEVEAAGLLKIDVIGQKGLAVIKEAAEMAEENERRPLHPERIDYLGDPETKRLIREGRTEGCFYIESPGMIQLIRQARCDDFEVLTALSSIIRPGVSSYGGKRQYLRRHLGLEPVELLHPALEPVLRDTYGCLIYQEQVIRVAVAVAGMSLGEADGLRRCMAYKNLDDETMNDYRGSFMRGALARGVPEETAAEIFRQVASFAGYAFCKAHSASFALESFESAYWKAHYPAEFMAAILSNGGGYYSQEEYLEEARRMGIEILGPCVNASALRHRGRGRELRLGLMQVKGLSAETGERIVRERPYRSLGELLDRTRPARDEAESLIACGALRCLGRTRPQLLWELRLLESGKEEAPRLAAALPRIDDYDLPRSVAREIETLDLAVSAHPLAMFAGPVERARREAGAVRSCDLPRRVGCEIGVIGWKVTWKSTRTNESAEEMIFVTFSDEWGRFEATFFPEAYRRAAHTLFRAPGPFLIRGRVESELGVESLIAEDLLLVA